MSRFNAIRMAVKNLHSKIMLISIVGAQLYAVHHEKKYNSSILLARSSPLLSLK